MLSPFPAAQDDTGVGYSWQETPLKTGGEGDLPSLPPPYFYWPSAFLCKLETSPVAFAHLVPSSCVEEQFVPTPANMGPLVEIDGTCSPYVWTALC